MTVTLNEAELWLIRFALRFAAANEDDIKAMNDEDRDNDGVVYASDAGTCHELEERLRLASLAAD